VCGFQFVGGCFAGVAVVALHVCLAVVVGSLVCRQSLPLCVLREGSSLRPCLRGSRSAGCFILLVGLGFDSVWLSACNTAQLGQQCLLLTLVCVAPLV
jgi:hypothetical protein